MQATKILIRQLEAFIVTAANLWAKELITLSDHSIQKLENLEMCISYVSILALFFPKLLKLCHAELEDLTTLSAALLNNLVLKIFKLYGEKQNGAPILEPHSIDKEYVCGQLISKCR